MPSSQATGGCLSVIYSACPLGACTSSVPLHRSRHVHRNFLTSAITDRFLPCYHWLAESVDARKHGRSRRRCCCMSFASFFVSSKGQRRKKKDNKKKKITSCISELVSRIGPETIQEMAHSLLARAAKPNRWCTTGRQMCSPSVRDTLSPHTLPRPPPFSVGVR